MEFRKMVFAAAVAAAAAAGAAVRGTVTTANGSQSGMVTWSRASNKYTVEVQRAGGGAMSTDIAEKDVISVSIEKPAAFDQAVRTRNKAALERIVKEYSHLTWDVEAGAVLAELLRSEGDKAGALSICQNIVGSNPQAAWKGSLAPAYWRALLDNDKESILETNLKKAVASGDRFTSGSALLLRGDRIMKNGKTHENARRALLEGYLRVALLYTEEEVRDRLAPEAFSKSADCFEILGYSSKAAEFRSKAR